MHCLLARSRGYAAALALCLTTAAPGLAAAQYGIYFDCHRPDPVSPPHIDHPHVDGVLLRWGWADIEPKKGTYDFAPIERDIAPWVKAGKRVLIGLPLAGQHNVDTPQWLYEEIERINFVRSGKGTHVSVPKYWDPSFVPRVAGMVRALGARYDKDPRIEAVMIGIGHIGFLTAAPNANGANAFLDAGWTPQRWKDYTAAMIALYREAFPSKPLFIRGADLVLRCPDPAAVGFAGSRKDFLEVGHEILLDAALRHGIGIGTNGLDADVAAFEATGIPSLYERLGPGALEGKYRLEIADDWPLWVNAKRRAASKVDRQSDTDHYKRCLENAVGAAPGLPRLPIGWMKMLETDLDCTHPKHPDYQKECEEKLIWLKGQLLPPVRK
ncbi:MAG: beta-galactosidase [Planctomycetota bacterium]